MADAQVLQLYQGVSSRLIELVRTDPSAGVPSCPEWCALDLLRHVCAVAEDWAEGRLTGYGTQKWTDEGVKRLSDLELDRIADAWRRAITQMADLPDQVGMGDPVRFAFGDAAVHEADLRAALAPETCLASHSFRSCFTASMTRNIPRIPGWFDDSPPPSGFTGNLLPKAMPALLTKSPPSPGSQKPRFSSVARTVMVNES